MFVFFSEHMYVYVCTYVCRDQFPIYMSVCLWIYIKVCKNAYKPSCTHEHMNVSCIRAVVLSIHMHVHNLYVPKCALVRMYMYAFECLV